MFNKIFKSLLKLCLWSCELLLLCASFFAITSTIEFFPWYDPLTMGAFFMIIYLIPIQIVVAILYIIRDKKHPLRSHIQTIPLIHSCLLVFIFILAEISGQFFYTSRILISILQVLLIFAWLFIREQKNCSYPKGGK